MSVAPQAVALLTLLMLMAVAIACGGASRAERLQELGLDPTHEAAFADYAEWRVNLYTDLLEEAEQEGADDLVLECLSILIEVYSDWRKITPAEKEYCEPVIYGYLGEETVEEAIPVTPE